LNEHKYLKQFFIKFNPLNYYLDKASGAVDSVQDIKKQFGKWIANSGKKSKICMVYGLQTHQKRNPR